MMIDYLSTRQLPALDTLQNNYQNDDYIRIKLSGMSVGVSPNSSPRGHPQYQHEQRGSEYFPSQVEERRVYDPIRSSNQTPLIRRIMHQDPLLSQRRHSIANMDLNTRSSNGNNNNNICQFFFIIISFSRTTYIPSSTRTITTTCRSLFCSFKSTSFKPSKIK